MSIKEDISRLVRDKYNVRTGIAILAAIEVAANRWTEQDTITYGKYALEDLTTINKE